MNRILAIFLFSILVSGCGSDSAQLADNSNKSTTKVKENLQIISDAYSKSYAHVIDADGDYDNDDNVDDMYKDLVKDGYLANWPSFPNDTGSELSRRSTIENPDNFISSVRTYRRAGGCGNSNSGAPKYVNFTLLGVTADFCKAYNEEQGLGLIIIPNCNSGDCHTSGSSNSTDFPETGTNTFCYNRDGDFTIVMSSNILAPPSEICN